MCVCVYICVYVCMCECVYMYDGYYNSLSNTTYVGDHRSLFVQ